MKHRRSCYAFLSQHFIDARAFLVVNWRVMKRVLITAVGLLTILCSALGQGMLNAPSSLTLYRPDVFKSPDSFRLFDGLPSFGLSKTQQLAASIGLGGIGSLDSLSMGYSVPQRKESTAQSKSSADPKDSLLPIVDAPLHPVYATGEVGVLYGRWSDKFSGDLWQTYMVGEVGNDRFHIVVGAEYEESSARLPRFRTFAPLR